MALALVAKIPVHLHHLRIVLVDDVSFYLLVTMPVDRESWTKVPSSS
jgi:hypothetical protein